MKLNLLLTVVALALGYYTYKKRSTTPASVPTMEVTPAAPTPDPPSVPPAMVEVPKQKLPAPAAKRRTQLCEGWWYFHNVNSPTDKRIAEAYRNKMLKFYPDQRMEVLVKGEVQHYGWWNFDEQAKVFYLSCPDPYINNTWQVPIEEPHSLVLLGDTELNKTGIRFKIINTR